MVGGLTVFGNCALTLRLWKKTPPTYTFSESLIVIEYNHTIKIFLKVNVAVILKEKPRNTALPKLVCFRAWSISIARLSSETFSHTSPSKIVSAIFQMCFGFFYNLFFLRFFNVTSILTISNIKNIHSTFKSFCNFC